MTTGRMLWPMNLTDNVAAVGFAGASVAVSVAALVDNAVEITVGLNAVVGVDRLTRPYPRRLLPSPFLPP